MTRPDFTTWLRDLEPPETEWRPYGLKGSVGLQGTGDLMDWVGQGFGGVNVNDLLDAVEKSCRKRRYDPATVLILAYKSEKAPYPFEVHNNQSWHISSNSDQITIYFPPIKEGV